MKKMLCIIPITFLALLLVVGMGNQNCLADTVPSILLIDSDDDDTTVTLDINRWPFYNDDPYSLYYSINSGVWNLITFLGDTPPLTAQLTDLGGGSTLDFGLDLDGDGMDTGTNLYSNDNNDAALSYSGERTGIDVQIPLGWSDPFYGSVTVNWIGLGAGAFELDFVVAEGKDGLAPVPIPTSVLLLGAGLLGLIGIGYRRRKSTAAKFEEQ